MTSGQEVKLKTRPAGKILVAGVVLGAVLGWYVRDFTATRDVASEAKVRLIYCIQSAMGRDRDEWLAQDLCALQFQLALEKFFNRSGAMEEELRDRWVNLRCMAYAHTRRDGKREKDDCTEMDSASMEQLSNGLRELISKMDEAAAGFWP